MKEAHKVMGMVNTLAPLMEQALNQWAKVQITDKEVQRLIQIALAPNKETLNNIRDGRVDETSTVYKNQCYSVFGYAMMADAQQMETTKGTLSEHTMRLQAIFKMCATTKMMMKRLILYYAAELHRRKYRQLLICVTPMHNMVQMLYYLINHKGANAP